MRHNLPFFFQNWQKCTRQVGKKNRPTQSKYIFYDCHYQSEMWKWIKSVAHPYTQVGCKTFSYLDSFPSVEHYNQSYTSLLSSWCNPIPNQISLV